MVFDYRPRGKGQAILAILFFGGALAVFLNQLTRSLAGKVVNGPRGPTPEWFLWSGTVACIAFVIIGLAGLIAAIRPPRKLIITETGITCPKRIFARDVTIPFSAISEVTLRSARDREYLEIRHSDGKLTIPALLLPPGALVRVRAALGKGRDRA